MNVYDFDKTIYNGDSTIDYYFYCLKTHPAILRYLPIMFYAAILYLLKFIDKTNFKRQFYRFLRGIPNIDESVTSFWEKHMDKVKPWYLKTHQYTDVVISASPEFLLEPACKKLHISHLMASKVDKYTGIYTGVNCYGKEKVRRFREIFGDAEIEEFYSDSLSDSPLADISEKSFIVNGDRIIPWTEYKK